MKIALALLAVVACGPETTSFRTTDQGDERVPAAAAIDVRLAGGAATVHVWSSGGYVSATGEPMQHVGLDVANVGTTRIDVDTSALELRLFGKGGIALPAGKLSTVAPLGPAVVPVAAGTTTQLDGYFVLPVRPRAVEAMQVRWSIRAGDERYIGEARFVRDDDVPVVDTAVPRS